LNAATPPFRLNNHPLHSRKNTLLPKNIFISFYAFQLKKMNMSETILFIDSEEHLLNSLEGIFSVNHFRYLKASNAADALRHLSREQVAVAVMDSRMTDIAGTGFLTNIREASPDTIRMMMTENTDIARAVDAISRGDIYRFILKPLNITELLHILEDAVKRFQLVLSLKNEDRTSLLSVAQTLNQGTTIPSAIQKEWLHMR
jgi:DNA-binding NtrC family response regulator